MKGRQMWVTKYKQKKYQKEDYLKEISKTIIFCRNLKIFDIKNLSGTLNAGEK